MRNWTREAIIEVLKEVYKKWVKDNEKLDKKIN